MQAEIAGTLHTGKHPQDLREREIQVVSKGFVWKIELRLYVEGYVCVDRYV